MYQQIDGIGGMTLKSNAIPGAPKPSLFVQTLSDIANANQRISEMVERARSIADDVFGPAAQLAGGGKDAATPQGFKAHEVERAMEEQRKLLSALDVQLDRLTCL